MPWWTLTAAANALIVLAYILISLAVFRGGVPFGRGPRNPLALATGLIFLSCAVGHGQHLLHAIPPLASLDPEAAAAARATFADPRLLAWDAFTAGIGVWYVLLRGRLGVVYGGVALCEDLEARQKEAAILHANVVECIRLARDQLARKNADRAAARVTQALASSKNIVTHLLGDESLAARIAPGDLRREAPSGGPE